jgi:hypothetical protein
MEVPVDEASLVGEVLQTANEYHVYTGKITVMAASIVYQQWRSYVKQQRMSFLGKLF